MQQVIRVIGGGLASVAGTVSAGYASMGVEMKYLLAASFMVAPDGLLYAKLMLGGIGKWFGMPDPSMLWILDWVFAPLAWLAGIPLPEIRQSVSLIGQKLVLNEFVAYVEFTGIQAAMTEKTRAICSVELCGFANLSSIAILLGGLGGMAPTRRQKIAQLGLKAVAAGTLSNLTSATIVGIFVIP